MEIEILDIRLLPGEKSTRAFADVSINGILLRDFRIYQPHGKPSVRNPFTAYRDAQGKLVFRQFVDLPATVQGEVDSLILIEYYRRLKEKENGSSH